MKKSMMGFLVAAACAFSATAGAQTLELGYPSYGGNGCPQGSASVNLDPASNTISMLFDQYIVEAGSNGKTLDRKSCQIRVPVKIPQGWSFSIIQVDYRGFVSLPSYSSRAQFSAEYFFAGMRGPRKVNNFYSGYNSDYLITNKLGIEALVWSPCGAEAMLSANTAMLVSNSDYRSTAMATVDSADITAGLIYHIQWRRCN
jgi:hypothetical protein